MMEGTTPTTRILIIEDDDSFRLVLSRMLKLRIPGAEPEGASSLQEGLDRLHQDNIHLVLIDLGLPDSHGLEGLEAIHQQWPALPVIIMTGQSDQGLALQALRRGAQDYLVKGDLSADSLSRTARYALERKQAEIGLRQAKDFAESIVKHAKVLVLVTDTEGRVTSINEVAEKVLDTPSDALKGRNWFDIFTPLAPRALPQGQQPIWPDDAPQEFRCQTPTGDLRVISWRKGAILHPDQIFFGLDITARYKAEQQQRYSERLMAATLDAFTASIAIVDDRGVIIASNAFWSLEDDPAHHVVYGHAIGNDYADYCQFLVRENLAHAPFAQGFLDVLYGKLSKFAHDYQILSSGNIQWFGATVFGFQSEGIRRIGIAVANITQRKSTEEKLRESEELFRLITENAVDLVALLDASGRRLYTSPSYTRVLGYSREEIQQAPPLAFLHPDDRQKVAETLAKMFQDNEDTFLEYRMQQKDGAWREFESKGALIRDPEGQNVQGLIIARDVTERNRTERERQSMELQLRQALRMEAIGQLAAGIAHEINTPTQYIGDNAKFLLDAFMDVIKVMDAQQDVLRQIPTADNPAALLQILESVKQDTDLSFLREEIPKAIRQSLEGVARVSKIVRAMRDFSHPGGDSAIPVDLNQAIESTLTVSRNEWKYVADAELDLDPELPPVTCFPGEINQVVLNLIINAAHTIADVVAVSPQEKGSIRISTKRDGDYAEFRIQDSGAGIPEHIRPRIFDLFFTTKPVGKGTGQGLSIAHSVIVDKHKGSIRFETEIGRGTTFIVRLPIAGPTGQETIHGQSAI